MRPTTLASLLTIAGCAASLAAQTVTLPTIAATTEGNDLTSYPFGRTAFRAQQLFEMTQVAPSLAVITAMNYRADNDNSSAKPAVTLANVQVDVSQTTVDFNTMTTTYASNVTGTVSTVFTGSVNLPAYTSTPGGIAPFGITLPFANPFIAQTAAGNLIVDVTAQGANASSGYTLDSALPGGLVRTLGQSGDTGVPLDRLQHLVSANGPTQGRFSGLVPGGSVIVFTQASRAYTGDMFFGLAKFAPPIDLTALGAPGNELHLDVLIHQPFVMVPSGVAIRASVTLPVPNVPGLTGASIVSQSIVFAQPPGNTLGIVTTNGVEMTIGAPGNHPLRMVRGTDPNAATGSFNYTSGILGGPVVRFHGVFN